jgi:UDP:flavonoid glycosyltransferase YjiC (YdhE family)
LRILFTTLTSNDLGLLTRSLPIARELRERGHQIAFCNPARSPSKLIAEAGFGNLLPSKPLQAAILRGRPDMHEINLKAIHYYLRSIPYRMPPVTAEIRDMDHFGAMIGMLNEGFVRANHEAYVTLIRDFEPEVVVDFWNPFACLAARTEQKPLATVIQADLHPASQGFIWWQAPHPRITRPANIANKILDEYAREPVEKIADLFVGDLTLILGIPETDPLPATAIATYVGPILWQNESTKMPDWFSNLGGDKSVVWVYAGNPRYLPFATPMDSESTLVACIQVLAEEDVQVILTSGHHKLPKKLLPLPDNFIYEPFVPGLKMAQRSDLLIHHGGYGSCQTGLSTGTPAVIIPTYAERESNARRVAAAGAGEIVLTQKGRGWKRVVSVDELRTKIRRVLSEPTFKKNAQRISQKMKKYDGAREAVRQIESFSRTASKG